MSIIEDILGDSGYDDPDGEPLEPRLFAMIPGQVLKRDDPLKIGRIIARSDALFEQGTDWLYPLTMNGGSPNHGTFDPPLVGASIQIWFPLGQLDSKGYYLCTGWRKSTEVPSSGEVEGDKTRSGTEDSQWQIVRDDRSSKGEWLIKHKPTGNYIQLKEDGTFTVKADSGLLSEGADQRLVLGDKLVEYFGSGATVGSLINWLVSVQSAINTIAPGSLTVPPPSFPSDILSEKWKTK